jgi:hypothetical protein
MSETTPRSLAQQIERAWAELSHEHTTLYLMRRSGEFVLTQREHPGARPVGTFTKLRRCPDGKWTPLPFTEFREAVECVMNELSPG